jgi:iron complex outermembrane receptor protein
MAPRWTVSGSVSKRFSLPFGTLSLNWNGNFIDQRYASIDNNPATFVPSSFIHNARVSVDVDGIGTQFSVFVDNISNTARQVFGYDTTSLFGNWARTYAMPRVVGVSVRKSF